MQTIHFTEGEHKQDYLKQEELYIVFGPNHTEPIEWLKGFTGRWLCVYLVQSQVDFDWIQDLPKKTQLFVQTDMAFKKTPPFRDRTQFLWDRETASPGVKPFSHAHELFMERAATQLKLRRRYPDLYEVLSQLTPYLHNL